MPKAKTTPITDHERRVLAGIFARSNMGQGLPKVDDVQRALRQCGERWFTPQKKGDDFANYFCGAFMETYEHERIFASEAAMWFRLLGNRRENTREYMQRTHADIAALVWPQ